MKTPLTLAGVMPALLALVLSACGSSSPGAGRARADHRNRPVHAVEMHAALPARTVRFAARDFGFDGPSRVPAGLVRLELVNRGAQPHQLALFRLKPGVAPGTALGALAAAGNLEGGRAYGTWIAGPNSVRSHTTGSLVVDLQPGQYVLACLMPGPDGVLHANKGMLGNLEVTRALESGRVHTATDARLPTVTLGEWVFVLPKGFGRGSFAVRNAGTQVHELALVRLHDGVDVDDVRKYETTPIAQRAAAKPYDDVLGATFLDPKQHTRLDLDLPGGRYAALCFIPASDGKPHFMHGMAATFTVPSP